MGKSTTEQWLEPVPLIVSTKTAGQQAGSGHCHLKSSGK